MIRAAAESFGEDNLDCFVAAEDERLVGVIVFLVRDQQNWTAIRSLGVVKDRRRRGIGIELKRTVIDEVAPLGVVGVRSEVDVSNYKMKRLNEKLGIDGEQDPDGSEYLFYGARINVLADTESTRREPTEGLG